METQGLTFEEASFLVRLIEANVAVAPKIERGRIQYLATIYKRWLEEKKHEEQL